MNKLIPLLGALAISLAPLAAQAAPPHPVAATKPVVEHNIEVAQRHAKRTHHGEHAASPARDKTPVRGGHAQSH